MVDDSLHCFHTTTVPIRRLLAYGSLTLFSTTPSASLLKGDTVGRPRRRLEEDTLDAVVPNDPSVSLTGNV
ncbi:hypothetical protein C446_00550 [Halobiforma nitratireducens JCM 10879]|uniref:Uncharacterized protein n=1 Tax=Halobiforma nitratireducens JCM 10879 TaxID=1227454 RepID=M0MQY6_9EURY|nr:hypothetical protein C446_00550 [Halobiforma nitratireducens JCM 10879]